MAASPRVSVLDRGTDGIVARTGRFEVRFGGDRRAVVVSRRDAEAGSLRIAPGGPDAGLLSPETGVSARVDDGDVVLTAEGTADGSPFTFTLVLPGDEPGCLSYELTAEDTVGSEAVDDWEPEIAVHDGTGPAEDALRSYLDGTPGSQPAAGTSDLTQFVYAADETALSATLLYAADWLALDEYFCRTNTTMRDTVSAPPGRVGYRPPTPDESNSPVRDGDDDSLTVLAATLVLTPGTPALDEPLVHCERFVEDLATVYGRLDAPEPEHVDWQTVSEKTVDAITDPANRYEYDGEFHPGGVELVTVTSIVTPFRAYAERFEDDAARELTDGVADLVETYYDPDYETTAGSRGMIGNSPAPLTLTHVDAWYLFWPVIQAAEYALAFDDDRVAEMVVDAADVLVDVGRALDYEFPMWIDVDELRGHEPGGGKRDGYQYDCTGAYAYLMLQYHELTGEERFLTEAAAAGDKLCEYGFELPYEFTTTPLTPVAMARLADRTGDDRYLDASSVGLANVLRHAYFFDPEYGSFAGRNVFLLNEAMPPDGYEGNFFANALEEWSLLRYLDAYLREAGEDLSSSARQLTAELLRYKRSSLADSLPGRQPDPSLIYDGVSPQSGRRVNREWALPLEPFGALEPMFDQLGAVGQDLYGAGAYAEAALQQSHPLDDDATLTVEGPVAVDAVSDHEWSVSPLGETGTYGARLTGDTAALVNIVVRPVDGTTDDVEVEHDPQTDSYRFDLDAATEYTVSRDVPRRSVVVDDFELAPETVPVGESTTVSMTVENTGPQAGRYEVRLSVGAETRHRVVALDAHGERDVRFEVARAEPGTYNVQVSHQNRALEVVPRDD